MSEDNLEKETLEESIEKQMEDDDYEKEVEHEILEDEATIELSETEKLQVEIDDLKKSNEDIKDQLQRKIAEFDNFRKRTIKEKEGMYSEGLKESVEKFLPILDNLERALLSVENKEDNLYIGIDMIFKQFLGVLKDLGVTEIEAINTEFDHKLHFGVAKGVEEGFSPNTVCQVMQKGYMIKDKVLRCAMVKVAE